MTNEPQDAVSGSAVLAYAAKTKPGEWLPLPLWLRLGVIPAALYIWVLFVLGLPPLSGSLDYERNIPLSEVIDYARTSGIQGTLDSFGMFYAAMFAPIAMAGLLAFLFLQHVRPQCVAIVANLVLPIFWPFLPWPIFVFVGPPLLILAFLGQCDGETWSEGFVCFAATGSWTTLWLAVAILMVVFNWRQLQKSPVRFSLRTLLIVTTLFALLLGLVVWGSR